MILWSNLSSEGGETKPLGNSFFKQLRLKAIAEGLIDTHTGPSPDGMRQVVRDYFCALSKGAPALSTTSASSTGASSSSKGP